MPEHSVFPDSAVSERIEAEESFSHLPDDSASSGSKRKMGILFWFAVGWLGIVVFAAIFAPWLPLQSTTEADQCSTLASTMANYGIDGNAAKLLQNGEADTPHPGTGDVEPGRRGQPHPQ